MAGPLLDNKTRWRWAAASQIGTSHQRLGTRKQDALRCFVTEGVVPALCGIVCDGAGSAPFGGEGASVVCRVLSDGLRNHFRLGSELPTDEDVWAWLDLIRDRLALAAERRSVRRQAFASTLVMLVIAGGNLLTVHVGDGAIVARHRDKSWQALSWPENGEYASTTYFVTDDPAPKVRIVRFPVEYDAYALFSDGIEDLALNQQSMTPHEPFFRTMLNPVDSLTTQGKSATLSTALATFLNSPRVCNRTDDDKSLILASSL